jgi:predicted PurR-regulated permease PerM
MDELLAVKVPTRETEALETPELTAETSSFDAKLLVQIGLLVLAVLSLSYLAADIVLPIIFAFVMNLLFQPGMRALGKLHVPRALAALGLIFCVFGAIIGVGAAISGPAASWAQKLPGGVTRLEERLKV